MAGGLDMSFWIWVGVAIVVVLVVAFARDRIEQRHGRATREVTLNVASKGETLSDPHEGEFWGGGSGGG